MQTFLIAAASAVVAFVVGFFRGRESMLRVVAHLLADGSMREAVERTEAFRSALMGSGVSEPKQAARPDATRSAAAVTARPFPITGWEAGARSTFTVGEFECPLSGWVGVAIGDKCASVCVISPMVGGCLGVSGRSFSWGVWSAEDYGAVVGHVKEVSAAMRVNAVSIDPWKASFLGSAFEKMGIPVEACRTTRRALDKPRRALLSLMEQGRLLHDNDRGLRWGMEASLLKAGAVPSDDGLMTFSWDSLSADKHERLPVEALTLALAAKMACEEQSSRKEVV